MTQTPLYRSIGLMSGTSADGIDAAVVTTDGEMSIEFGACLHRPYEPTLKNALLREAAKGYLHKQGGLEEVERRLTVCHAEVVASLLDKAQLRASDVQVVGLHGHTLSHIPQRRFSWQLGDGQLLADMSGIDVVADFRQQDLRYGGEGAPLAPLFHHALLQGTGREALGRRGAVPCAVLNVGGVANLTVMGEAGIIHAFDTGPGCALLDDWMRVCGVEAGIDTDGEMAARGRARQDVVADYLRHEYFRRAPPKSLDRHDFGLEALQRLKHEGLTVEDGAATLVALTAACVVKGKTWSGGSGGDDWQQLVVSGGGRHNKALLAALKAGLAGCVDATAEDVGWQGDFLEAQAFAWLAVRAMRDLPLSVPATTGVGQAVSGGTRYQAKKKASPG
ncbi:MAG: anhydro-N-acetylmuramic acid kinase [Alphaproteobacteria bacterium GM202ARS2]|nr:anhydro-N-acetylmuramic acid kinase [Alphaproteobacteria bacterium GM202ARS2]